MVYISNGRVQQAPPWSIQRLVGLLWGILAFISYFFRTLIGLEGGSSSSGSGSNGRRGPGNGPGGGPKRIGRITTIDDCSMPGGG